jgi:acetylornithine deacetylase/succinyl-diaminopimelate desuccinylase-like protein
VTGDGSGAFRLLSVASSLAFPRKAGSEGSRKVVEMLVERLEGLELEVAREDFSYDLGPVERGLRWLLAVGAALSALSAALVPESPLAAAAMLSLTVVAGSCLLGWSPWLENLYRRSGPIRTANVVGRRRVPAPRKRIILMAHHDSKSQSLGLPARLAATFGAMFGLLGLATVTALVLIGDRLPIPDWLPMVLGAICGLSLLALATMRSGNASPGGVDNAGSMAIVLELVERVSRLPNDVELVVLLTGAEEDHMVGAMRWVERHADDIAGCPTMCLNFDGAGSPGRTVLITRYGPGRSFAPGMERIAVAAARRLGQRVRRIVMAPAVGIDAIPFVHRGIECLTVSSGSLGRATWAVHSRGDVADNLDGPTMARITDLAAAVVERLAT